MLLSFGSFAACNLPPLFTGYVSMQNILVQRDLPIGSIIATVTDEFRIPNTSTSYICRESISVNYLLIGEHNKTNFENVYTTNIPGVGVRILANGFYKGQYITNPATNFSTTLQVGHFYPWSISMKFELVKIGTITPGTFSSGKIADISAMNYQGIFQPYFSLYVSGNLIVKQAACNVRTNVLAINLNNILTTRFTAVGSTFGEKRFTIGLNCEQGAKINVSLNGTTNKDTSEKGVLAPVQNSSVDSANGVAIQILSQGVPVTLNSNSFFRTSNGGDDSLEFTARYYQTKRDVSSGVIHSIATLTITYQ